MVSRITTSGWIWEATTSPDEVPFGCNFRNSFNFPDVSCVAWKAPDFLARRLPGLCTAFSQAFSVNSLWWRHGQRARNTHSLLRCDHVTRNALAAQNNGALGQIIIIIIKVNYNNYKKISQNPLRQFFKKLCNFDNFIRRRLSDHNKITFAIKYLPVSHPR